MARDPVCGMEVDPQHAAAQAAFNGLTYYFDSQGCKEQFELEPARYAQRAAADEERIRSEGVDIIEEDRPSMTHGIDVIEGHGPDTTTSGADVVDR